MGVLEQPCTLALGDTAFSRGCWSNAQVVTRWRGPPATHPEEEEEVWRRAMAAGMGVLSASPALRQGNCLQELLTRRGGM